ncbi:glucokinase [Chitinophaga terrae (ex Kim and Jung 2007)]|uniref:Glucokinase n=1 Tax=Chitinophaga terrae (ex Kim and Jung 2007) TaxID=408074 RepID=A0A1H4E2Y4_9BACT|nr:ROK family protein [Chitinophaga terrae (ex Kim and Jung 2007)]MDQ0108262.1 glucokinase [Chitinophaga terrae (ex Kim and Jung 2007)]SEA79414.1 glucokinase [Chitinophaga terrae (ex Kim and Jung 2007)]
MSQQLVVGIDIGGTNTKFGVVDRRGNILCDGRMLTNQHEDVNGFLDELHEHLSGLIEQAGGMEHIKGIGVGAPNGNYYTGNIEYAPNLRWKGIVPLASLLEQKFGLPTVLTNDANAAALGELIYGAARGMKDFIVITLGTGVGSGIVANGQLIYGHDGFAGELGHCIVIPDGRPHPGTGALGSLEAYASATGVTASALEFLATRPDTPSTMREHSKEEINSKLIYEAAMQGDPLAREVYEFTGKILGAALANFVMFSSPEAIILFGGLTKAGDLIMKPVREHMEKNLLPIFQNKVKLLFSELKESDAAILGASALAWEMKE